MEITQVFINLPSVLFSDLMINHVVFELSALISLPFVWPVSSLHCVSIFQLESPPAVREVSTVWPVPAAAVAGVVAAVAVDVAAAAVAGVAVAAAVVVAAVVAADATAAAADIVAVAAVPIECFSVV